MPDSINRRGIAEWYNRRYANKQLKAYRPYAAYEHFLNSSQSRFEAGTRLLDVGSGQGFLLKAAAARGLRAFGVDLSLEAIRVSRNGAPQASGVTAVGESLPFQSGAFEYLTCMGTLEHHLDMQAALREFARVTTPNARLILSVPNRNFLGYAPFRRKGTAQQEIKETLLSLDEWRSLLENAGLEVLRIGIDDWFLRAPLDLSRGIGYLGRQILRKVALLVSPFKRTYAFLFVCRKLASS